MDYVKECTRELTKAICESQAYTDFERAKEKISRYPELHNRLIQFRKKNYKLQNGKPDEHWYEEILEFERANEEFRQNPLVKDYLNSELELCRMIQKINFSIMKTLQMEIEEFADEIHL